MSVNGNEEEDASPSVIEMAKEWAKMDPNPATSDYVEKLAARTDSLVELAKLFPSDGARIGFGTAGLRSAMKVGPLGMNDLVVVQTTQGVARYCLDGNEKPSSLKRLVAVVGYDHRCYQSVFSSRSFALLTKLVFLEAGMDCVLLDGYVPTPLVAYATTKLHAAVGVMITASHNPKTDAGYKLYWSDGCQIRPPLDGRIADSITRNLTPWIDYRAKISHFVETCGSDPSSWGLTDKLVTTELADSYFQAIASSGLVAGQWCNWTSDTANSWTPPKVAYTAMHGVGHEWAVRSYQTFRLPPFLSVPQQERPDADFPTVTFPNPEEDGALDVAFKFSEENGCDIVLANDPDADRLAVAEKCRQSGTWTTFTGDQIGTMLGHWLWETIGTKSKKPVAMCASTVSSTMLRTIAETEGFYFEDTLTGFKWIGSRLLELPEKEGYHPLFAYEEAIGFCCGNNVVFDKDGISALGVMTELAFHVYHNADDNKKTLKQHMQSLYDKYGEFVCNNGYFYCYNPDTIRHIIEELQNGGSYMTHVGPYQVESIRDLSFPGYDSTTLDKKPIFPSSSSSSSSSSLVTIRFTNGCITHFRASGTEPKLKYYMEMRGQPGTNREIVTNELKTMSNVILNELLKPKQNGLTTKHHRMEKL